jgi:chemotaxis signal transduction protein
MSEHLDVLLIRVGPRTFGLPLEHIRYVAAMPPDFVAQGTQAASHFVFAGDPLPYVGLWDYFSLASIYDEYVAIQSMLPQRCQDHLDWINDLENSIRTGSNFSKARSPRECAFGKWFYSYQTNNLELSVSLSQFEHPHAQIHQLADKLLGWVESGKKDDALAALEDSKNTVLKNLLDLFDFTETLVHHLQRRIALVCTQGLAIGADTVLDIIKVPPAAIKTPHSHSKTESSKTVAALLVLEDETIAPLLDVGAFVGNDFVAPLPSGPTG